MSIFFALLFLASSIPYASAEGIVSAEAGTKVFADAMSAYLVDDEGNTEIAVGYLVETNQHVSVGTSQVQNISETDDLLYATYAFDLYSDGDTITPRLPSTETTKSDNDSGYCSRVYLTIKCYNTRDTPTEYLLYNVSGYWVISDSKASVKSAKLTYGCVTGVIDGSESQIVYDRAVGNNFSINTGFTIYAPSIGFGSTLGANLTLTYLMGTARTWTFTLYNNLL